MGIEKIAPALILLPGHAERRSALIRDVLSRTAGKPMLSFVFCPGNNNELVRHLRNQLEAVDATGKAFLMRYADSRAFDILLRIFNPSQRERFLSRASWWYFRRDGDLRRVSGASGAHDGDSTSYRFDEPQMQALESMSRVDGNLPPSVYRERCERANLSPYECAT